MMGGGMQHYSPFLVDVPIITLIIVRSLKPLGLAAFPGEIITGCTWREHREAVQNEKKSPTKIHTVESWKQLCSTGEGILWDLMMCLFFFLDPICQNLRPAEAAQFWSWRTKNQLDTCWTHLRDEAHQPSPRNKTPLSLPSPPPKQAILTWS